MAESFFSSLKKERIRKRIYKTRDLAKSDVFDYIEVFYNRVRRHTHLGGVSPEAISSIDGSTWVSALRPQLLLSMGSGHLCLLM